MLVVDLYTLQTVYVLNLINDILLNSGRTLDGEDIAWGDNTIRKWSTSANGIVLLYQDLL